MANQFAEYAKIALDSRSDKQASKGALNAAKLGHKQAIRTFEVQPYTTDPVGGSVPLILGASLAALVLIVMLGRGR